MVCEFLVNRLKGEHLEEQSKILKPTLIVRESSGGQSAS
jgi:DNA-binding LacI/PurR family transcriptional regulator